MKKIIALFVSLVLALSVAVAVTAQDAYTATFSITGGNGTITVYDTQDYTSGYTSDTAVARDSDTGEIDVSGSGQINFTVVPADGYEVASVTVTGGYKNLKGPSDTGVDDTYRITKVTSDLTVSVVLEESDDSEADTGDPVITFTDEAATVAGSETGVSISGTNVKITAAGTYTFTGSCSNGSIVVKKGVTGVTLILDGLTLTASATAPITCNKGSGVTIVAAAGSVNNLADDQYNNDDVYTDETTYPDIENAVIKCKDGSNVTISGTGTINVTAYGKNGVKGGADLYEEDADGNYTDVLLSTASLTIEDVTLNVSIKHSYKDPEDASSYDGDGIKSEKELNILSGNITVSANDDGVKCDYTLNIGAEGTDGPTINVTKATEGIEGSVVNVYSGNIYVTASDDGINAANGDIAERSADFSYNQYGGYVYVNVTNGDGIDSNGSVNLAGGTLEVYAPSQGDGDPIDTEYGCAFSGATVLAVGHNAMMQNFSGAYVAFGGNSGGMGGFGGNTSGNLVTAGSAITVKDASGNTLYTGKAVRNASYVVFASPTLTSGSSCTLYNGSSSVSTATAAASSGGTQPGGTQPGGMGGNPGRNPFGDQTDVSQPDGTLPDDMGQSGTRPGGMVPGGTRPGSDRSGADPFGDLPENTTAAEPASTTDQTAMPTAPAAPSEIAEPTTEAEITTATETPATDPQTAASDETTTDASAAEFILGDVNGDGVVDAIDARLVLRAAAKLDTLSGAQLLAADVNGDGIVDATDARAILRAAAKLEELTST